MLPPQHVSPVWSAPQEDCPQVVDLQDLVHLQAQFHLVRYHPLHLHQRQCVKAMSQSGHPYTLNPRRQEEPGHQMVQEEAQGQAQGDRKHIPEAPNAVESVLRT